FRMRARTMSARTVAHIVFSVAIILAIALQQATCAADAAKQADRPALQATVKIHAAEPGRDISPELFGIFFEDINYAADGGLYAELVQNRSFEYSADDNRGWSSLTAWTLVTRGGGKGTIAVESAEPLNAGNPHYAVLKVENGGEGVGLMNAGFDGFP